MSRQLTPHRPGSPRLHRLLLVTVAVLLAVVVLAAGCGDDDTTETGAPTTTAPPEDGGRTDEVDDTVPPAGCDTGDWTAVDTGEFTFRVPADLVDQEVQGIDSLVGEYRRPGMAVHFDYGWYSPDFDGLVGATTTAVTVDGRPGSLVAADPSVMPGPEATWFLGLHVPDPDAEADSVGGETSLALWIDYDDEADLDEATCITETVSFS